MKLSLLVLTTGKQEGKVLEIKLPQFLVGRDPQCHLRPASALISKRHCAIIQRDEKAFIRDFGSTNGTFVNDEPVQGERELNHGDQLKIGPISFSVRLEAGTATPSKTPAPATKSPTKTLQAKGGSPTPAPATSSAGKDDDIAAMLLSLEDGDSPSSAGDVPEGSTVFDLKAATDEVPPPGAPAAAGADKNKAAAKPAPSGDTRSAAANILEKMMKRPRST
jgi:pSer/pThr/pTyr-binding forkhead associated (FHA) protein